MITREIFSLQHPIVKHLVKLREERQYRYANRHVFVSGKKQVLELTCPLRTLILEQGYEPLSSLEAEQVFIVPPQILKKITGHPTPEPIAAEVAMPPPSDLRGITHLLILDGIADPGNLGTLMRTALGLGWNGVFLTSGSTDPYHEKALSAAKGATFKMPWRSGSWEELNALLQEGKYTLIAADLGGKPLQKTHFMPPLALALGNESHGVNPSLKAKAQSVLIPMDPAMESLNVASAGAILMFTLGKRE